jgi:chromosomal replication initiation ATPase DnaA
MLYGPHSVFGQALTPSQRAAQRNRREAEARIAKAAAQAVIADTTAATASVIAAQSDSSAFFATAWNMLGSAAAPPDQRSSPHWTVQAILQTVCDHYQVPPADVVSASRTQELVVPRQVAMYLARTLTKRSLPEIGRRFGQRRHTTVLHAVRKMTSRLPRDAQLARDVAAITHKLKDRSVPKL